MELLLKHVSFEGECLYFISVLNVWSACLSCPRDHTFGCLWMFTWDGAKMQSQRFCTTYILCWDSSCPGICEGSPWLHSTMAGMNFVLWLQLKALRGSSHREGMCNKKALCLSVLTWHCVTSHVLTLIDLTQELMEQFPSSLPCFKLPSCTSPFDGFDLYIRDHVGLLLYSWSIITDLWLPVPPGAKVFRK